MSDARLLIAIEVLDFLRTLSRREQEKLLKRCRETAAFPSNYVDYSENDAVGRRLGVHVFGKFAIKFWKRCCRSAREDSRFAFRGSLEVTARKYFGKISKRWQTVVESFSRICVWPIRT
jgi:hypothetical protein